MLQAHLKYTTMQSKSPSQTKGDTIMAGEIYKQWSRDIKKEVKRLEKAGKLHEAAWLANAHAKQVITRYGGTL